MFYVNGVRVSPTIFPDQTSQIWNLPEQLLKSEIFTISWKFDNEGEIMHLAQLYDLLKLSSSRIKLYLGYMPYGRQDKEISNKTTFALSSFSRLINSMPFETITIMDPHSSVATDRLMADAVYPKEQIKSVIKLVGAQMMCYPDKGARKKYSQEYTFLPTIHGDKVRDQLTGKITNYELKGDPKDQNVLIVDDICDGGATFIILAKQLYNAGAKRVDLFVTHGIFSRGLLPLQEAGILRIFTQDGEASRGIQNQIAYRRL